MQITTVFITFMITEHVCLQKSSRPQLCLKCSVLPDKRHISSERLLARSQSQLTTLIVHLPPFTSVYSKPFEGTKVCCEHGEGLLEGMCLSDL